MKFDQLSVCFEIRLIIVTFLSVLFRWINQIPLRSRFIVHLFESARCQLHDLGPRSSLPIGRIVRPEHNTLGLTSTEYAMFGPHTVTQFHLLSSFLWADWFLFECFQCFIVAIFTNLIKLGHVVLVLSVQSIRLYNRLINCIKWLFGCLKTVWRINRNAIEVREHVVLESLFLSLSVVFHLQL